MKDKNSIIGFTLLGLLFIGFFYFSESQQAAQLQQKKHIEDSLAKIEKQKTATTSSIATAAQDSAIAINEQVAKDTNIYVENEVIKVWFSGKGGQIKSVELKKYPNAITQKPTIIGNQNNNFNYTFNNGNNLIANSASTIFTPSAIEKKADGSQIVSFSTTTSQGASIVHQYIIKPKEYLIDWNINAQGADQLFHQNTIQLDWTTQLTQQEHNAKYESDQSRINFYNKEEGYDFERTASGGSANFKYPVQWFGFKQQFFNQTLLLKSGEFNAGGSAEMKHLTDTSKHILFDASAKIAYQTVGSSTINVPLQVYFGPTDYQILSKEDNGMSQLVDLGSGIYAFVRPINKYIIIPVFDFLTSFITNYGWAIALLTIFIRLITSPLMFKSYLSGAKMRALRPEIDALREKYKGEQQKFAMEQMNLFRQAGVNPMGGCLPALIQLPIFVALYSFFNSYMPLRGESFLWAKDLSTYDVLFQFPIHIPLIGSHISLFTILACVTMMISSIYSMSTTPTSGASDDPSVKMMKWMPYLMPIMMFFIFNNQPSALSWYYTVSNIITLIIQFVILNFIIDPDKILAQINEKRKQPKKKSKWQEKFEAMQATQQKLQEMKEKANRNK